MKNKKARVGTGILWIYKFFMLIVAIGGIVGIVWIHYSEQYDIREIEVSALTGKILECYSREGKMELCLNFNEDEIFIEYNNVSFGNPELKVYCEAKEQGTEGKNLPECLDKEYDLIINNVPEKLNLFVAVLKTDKNV